MRKITIIYFLFFLVTQSVIAQSAHITDGPYVFYRGGKVIVKSVVMKDSMATAVTDSSIKNLLRVRLDQHPEWDFTVQLKKTIKSRPPVFKSADKILVLSDIEGEFEPFRNLLLSAKVIDKKYNWTFGKRKLIVAGDLFDRGKQVCQFLWLLYKLEDEARAKGGDVNVILGNHDIMNLQGDFRYVQPEYLNNAALMSETYAALYAANTELGRWLRSKNTIEKIGVLLVMHAGMSPEVFKKGWSLEHINQSCRLLYTNSYGNAPDSLNIFFNDKALFWYRGYFIQPVATQGLVDNTLAFYHCKKIIVGHDIIPHIDAGYNGKVIGVDVNEHEGTHEALLIEHKHYHRMDDHGNRTQIKMN